MINDYKTIFPIPKFKKMSFSPGQGIDQIEPNWVWSIPRVPRT